MGLPLLSEIGWDAATGAGETPVGFASDVVRPAVQRAAGEAAAELDTELSEEIARIPGSETLGGRRMQCPRCQHDKAFMSTCLKAEHKM